MTARGERNRNPGNLDFNPNVKWQGQVGIETGVPNPRFAVFSDAKWGIRAIARQLLSYSSQHGLHTVRGLIGRWAPPSENNTGAYVAAVAASVGVDPDAEIDVDSAAVMTPLVKGIIIHENGSNPYTDAQIAEGIKAAGVADAPPPKLSSQPSFLTHAGTCASLVGAGCVAAVKGAIQDPTSAAHSVKGIADSLGDYASLPMFDHIVKVLLTVAGGLALAGIANQMLKQRTA